MYFDTRTVDFVFDAPRKVGFSVLSNMPDVAAGNNGAAVDNTVSQSADLAVVKSGDPDTVVAGEVLTYTVTVMNHGPSAAAGVVVTDTIPVSTTAQQAIPSQGSFDEVSGVWIVGDLALNESATLIFRVEVDPDAPLILNNRVDVTGDPPDPNDLNDFDEVDTAVARETDLAVEKTAGPEPVVAGEVLTYTVTVMNHGPSAATGVMVTDTIPVSTTARPAKWSRR